MTAQIFDIIRTSTVDGPGIRTAVFFKGCNLACRWCHNPESQHCEIELLYDRRKCIGCGSCARVCTRSFEDCVGCGQCAAVCPTGARTLCGHAWTVEALLAEVERDMPYYAATGGGVTCSGGECLLQSEFLCDFLASCRGRGIHTAVDTAGHLPWSAFAAVMPYTDLFLYDVKAADPVLHRTGTGVENGLILDNLRRLCEADAEVIVRVPVIGGFNADPAEQAAIAALLAPLPLRGVELLAYHAMGEHKYAALGRTAAAYTVPSEAEMAAFRRHYES